jgi:Biotin/lipoate A/B protein ligase family
LPIETTRRPRSLTPALDLPPPFRLVTLREAGDAFAHAQRIAAEAGAGTLVHVGRFDLAEFAVVLEPDEPLRIARRAIYAGLCALADALAVHAPPERPITFDWPDAVRVDGALVGGARLAWPGGADEAEPPDWLVFGAMVRAASMSDSEAGLRPLSAALDEEGFDDLGLGRLTESFARHLMVAIDTWQETGFGEIAKNFLARLGPPPPPSRASGGAKGEGVRRDLADNGDLLVRRMGQQAAGRQALAAALAAPTWLDPTTGAPR